MGGKINRLKTVWIFDQQTSTWDKFGCMIKASSFKARLKIQVDDGLCQSMPSNPATMKSPKMRARKSCCYHQGNWKKCPRFAVHQRCAENH